MDRVLFLIPLFPLAGALVLGVMGRFLGRLLSERALGMLSSASVAASAGFSIAATWSFLSSPPPHAYVQRLWTWMSVGGFAPTIALRLDALSLVMICVVTVVGFVIHIYSVEFMRGEDGFNRFFSYMNLFVASMLILVMADDLLLLYLGWEGVGLCSYLLIGFWYRDSANGRAAQKAFIVTRIGDTAMAIGLFLLFVRFGTLEIPSLLRLAAAQLPSGSGSAVLITALLLGGALGKSAQLPLQTWLPDAMAGPTPVSALIHAATMVTAGVYLIARTHVLFDLAPPVETTVAIIGATTLLISSFSALAQTDIKRVLAYSTISQIGYMFLALGVGAWPAAIFHLMTHAFFKALLFLAAGAVALALHHEHDIFKMGGLRKDLPWVFWTFLIGAASLSAFPFITSGFYSKDLILEHAYSAPGFGPWLWTAGVFGAFLTSLYSFRLFFIVFLGKPKTRVSARPGPFIVIPLVVLAILSVFGGIIGVPRFLDVSQAALHPAFLSPTPEWARLAPSFLSVLGILGAYLFYVAGFEKIAPSRLIGSGKLRSFFYAGWEFDRLYNLLFVQPYVIVSQTLKNEVFDLFFDAISWIHLRLSRILSAFQSGNLRRYLTMIGAGAVVLIFLMEVL